MNIADTLTRWADEAPFRAAIVDRRQVIHYRNLEAAVWRAAAGLAGAGLRPGDRVGLSPSVNEALWLVAAYALARIGAIIVLLDPLEAPAVRQAIARRLRLAALLGDRPAARLDGIALLEPQPDWLAAGPGAADLPLRADGGDAPMMICLSSGTTGVPKAMIRTHRDHATISRAGRNRAGEGPQGRLLALTSLHFTFGLYPPAAGGADLPRTVRDHRPGKHHAPVADADACP